MTSAVLTSPVDGVDSSPAIRAPQQKEKIRMQAQRYQRGSLTVQKRKSQPDMWVYRYYEDVGGKRTYRKLAIGTVTQFPKRKDAEKAVAQLRVDINHGADFAPINLQQLADHYQQVELPRKAYSTQQTYKQHLNSQILPKWGSHKLSGIKAVAVEQWLSTLKTLKGNQASPAMKSKIRNIMHGLFSHAIRYEWASRNPITSVRTSSKRLKEPEILTDEEFQALIAELEPRERVMVMLDGSTGLRRGELIALRWRDVDFKLNQAFVTHSIWRSVEGDCKTAASRKPVPLHPIVIAELIGWREASLYRSDDDFLFPSVQKNGTQPLQPDMILKRHIRPALGRIGCTKRIGWHSFRHGLATLLRQKKVDVKTSQELMRHANSRIMIDFYQQAVTEEKRVGQALACAGLFAAVGASAPSAP